MKHMKKLFSMVLAMALALSMGIGAFAANDGTITINDTVAEKTYTAYKLFDATTNGTAIAYTATENVKTGMEALDPTHKYFTFTADAAGTSYVVKQVAADKELTQWLTANAVSTTVSDAKPIAEITGVTATSVTATGTQTTIEGLAYGYYFVTTTNGAAISIDTAAPNATVNDKNGGPTWGDNGLGKVILVDGQPVQTNTLNVGDSSDFRITVNAADYNVVDKETKQVKSYTITDILPKGFTLNSTGFTVKVDGTTITSGFTMTPTANADETNTYTFTFADWTTVAKIATKSVHTIEITYSATLNSAAELTGNTNQNVASLDWKYTDGTDGNPLEDVYTDTYSFKLDLTKVDANDHNIKLNGVTFELRTKADDAATAISLVMDNGAYRKALAGETGNTTITTANGGLATVKGLANGTYYLVETKTNDGYNLLTAPVEIVINGDNANEFNGNAAQTVENSTGTVLPSTGGIGTTIFYVVGGLLVVGAGVLLITKKRIANK